MAKRKLTPEEVRYIRDNFKMRDKEFGGRALAVKFGVSHHTIQRVVNYEYYNDL